MGHVADDPMPRECVVPDAKVDNPFASPKVTAIIAAAD